MQSQFEQVWQDYLGAISRVAKSYEANPHLQEELVQEIGLACWHALPNCKESSALKGFVMRIAHNKAADHVAKHIKTPKGQTIDEEVLQLVSKTACSIEQTQQQERLLAGMRQLPLAQKQVIGLLLEGFSYQDIAEITGFSASNVGVLISRGKQTLTGVLYE